MYLRHSWTASVTAMILNVAAIVNAGANEANTYYVAPNGDDTNPARFARWFTEERKPQKRTKTGFPFRTIKQLI